MTDWEFAFFFRRKINMVLDLKISNGEREREREREREAFSKFSETSIYFLF